jgi:hypothetical protein
MQLTQVPQQRSEFLGRMRQNDAQNKLPYFTQGTDIRFVTTNHCNTSTAKSDYSSYETGNRFMVSPSGFPDIKTARVEQSSKRHE